MVSAALGCGLAMSLLYYELLGFSAGGLIAPAYVALVLTVPQRVGATLLAALLTWVVIRLLSSLILLFGRRRYVMTILVGFLLGQGVEALPLPIPLGAGADLQVIGYLVPGLIANDIERQGVTVTFLSLLAVAAAVRLVLKALEETGFLL